MIDFDSDALECDMAETYGIYDVSVLPVFVYAKLAVGLRSSSRIKMAMSGEKHPLDTNLLALIFDRLAYIFADDTSKVESMYEFLNIDHSADVKKTSKNGRILFKSADEFEQELERITYGR